MADGYLRPGGRFRTEMEVSRSRFIATIDQVTTVGAVRTAVADIQSELSSANHHVYAFVVGHGTSTIEGMSDAGEPSGTAGPPIMAVLRGSGLGDCMIVVTRYFGGTLLGTGGLVRAYSDAAKAAVAGVPLERKVQRASLLMTLPYTFYERTVRISREYDVIIEAEDFAGDVTLVLSLAVSDMEALKHQLNELSGGRIQIEAIER